jgi:hypothetical protein
MEGLDQVKAFATEHASTIGFCLLIAALLAAFAWFSLSRSNNPVLENKARVNETSTDSNVPPQEYVEEMARRAATQQSSVNEGDNTTE